MRRAIPIRRGLRLAGSLLLALAALPLCLSCFEQDPVTCWQYDVGAVEGYAKVLGVGVARKIRAHDAEDDLDIQAETMSDSTGYYRLELPSGLYRIGFYPGISYSDTVRVARRTVRHDILRGRAEIGIDMPAALENRSFGVYLRSSTNQYSTRPRVSDGHLSCVFEDIKPGLYSMRIYTGDEYLYLPGIWDGDQADSLTVTADEVALYDASFVDSYASVSGRVVGSWQEAGSSPPGVVAYNGDSLRCAIPECDSEGHFTCHLLTAEPVRLLSQYDGFKQWVGGATYAEATVFDLQPGDAIEGVEILESGIRVEFSGPGADDDINARVRLFDEAGNEVGTESAYGPRALIHNLRSGRYYLRVSHYYPDQVWASQWYDGAEYEMDAAPIDLAPGELKTIDLELFEGGRIEGRVYHSGGDKGEGDIRCRLVDENGHSVSYYNHATPNGEFSFVGLDNGTYYLYALREEESIWWYHGTHDFENAEPVVIENYGAVTGITWTFSDGGGE